jgi:septal ring factor EnvC (AmiA/AmiB activator)
MIKRQTLFTTALLTASLMAGAMNASYAAEQKSKKVKQAKPVVEQQASAKANDEKIAQMQKSIEDLKAEIAKIKTERSDLQTKVEQSDKDVAVQMQRIDDIKKKLAEKEQAAGVLEAEKKP